MEDLEPFHLAEPVRRIAGSNVETTELLAAELTTSLLDQDVSKKLKAFNLYW
jgi:hypothetical protein